MGDRHKSARLAARIRRAGRVASLLLPIAGLMSAAGTALPAHGQGQESPSSNQVQAKRPNVLIIVADDLGFADVGFNGAQFATPNIDRIATMGVVLDRFYVSPLCSPSRAGLLTGRYPHRYGIMGDTITPGSDFGLDPREETIADVLGGAGYLRRSFLGKWHLGHRSPEFHPMSFGFTSFYGHYNGAIDYFTHEREGEPDWHRDREALDEPGYSTDLLSDEAVRIIRSPSPNGSPWLMWLAYNAPHGPLQATAADLSAAGFDPSQERLRGGAGAREAPGYGRQGRGNTRRQTAIAMIRGMDRGIGRILDALQQTGQLENTLILFTSDNGGPLGGRRSNDSAADNGPLRGGKFQHYEGGVRVAAAIAWPAGLKPRTKAGIGLVSYLDILPTVAALADAPLHRPTDGQNISAALLSGRADPSERVLLLGEDYRVPAASNERGPTNAQALRGRAAAAIVGRWKLVGDQLFDLDTDPYEKRDVAAQHPDVVAAIVKRIDRLAALRQVPRERMNAAHLPPIPRWDLPE